jgi:hypothetical protein
LVHEPGNSSPAAKQPRRRRWQLGVRTLLLLMAAIAVWMAYFVNRRHNAALAARIKAMVPLAHELVIEDARKIAVVKLEEYWFDENRWEVYLPAGQYRLCVATHGIDKNGLAPVVKSTPIEAGRHLLALEQQRDNDVWRITALWDGRERIAVEEPKDWDPGTGSVGGGDYSLSEQLPPDQPAVLFRRRFMREVGKGRTTTPNGPTEGLMLWIERTAGPSTNR